MYRKKPIAKDYIDNFIKLFKGLDVSYAKRTDANQKEIVEGLRQIGASVFVLSHVGNGFPDICVGFRGHNFFLEIKNGSDLTPSQQIFHENWKGQVKVINNLDEAIDYLSHQSRKTSESENLYVK